jgi:hypothetical protein
MAIRKFRTGQMSYNALTYVGTAGTLFYDEDNGALRISDGVTPGGSLISYPIASSSQIGGVKLGPGVILNGSGQIIIDSEGLDFSFGDFAGIVGSYTDETEYALLSSINEDEDIVIASNGTGDIKVVGGFEVYATNGTVTGSLEDAEPFFRILDDGQVRILVPLADTIEGGMEIIGSELGTALAPGQAGTMLHLTGNADLPTRVYHDTLGDYGSYVFRRYNGSVATPTQVLANEDIARFNWTAANNAGMPNQATAQIRVTALENQTTTAQGSKIVFTVTPVGLPTSSRVDVATISTADGVSATKFTGPLTGNVTGDVSGSAGSVVNALTAGTYLTSGGTYNGSTARTFAVDATTEATASKVVARDASGDMFARRVTAKKINAVRDVGNPGATLALDFATDEIVRATLTADVSITYSNLLAGSEVTLILQKTGGGTDQVNIALNDINIAPPTLPGTDNNFDLDQDTCVIIRFISVGTTTTDLFAAVHQDQF